MSTEQTIREFVDRFYAALNVMLNGDPLPMLELWSHGAEATVMHPDGGRQMGWTEVRGALEAWAASVHDARITPREVSIRLITGDVAVVSVRETGLGAIGRETVAVDSRCTLVVRRAAGEWKAVHHHVDVNSRLRALVESSRSATVDGIANARLAAPAAA
jgi:ketosteroid isomerase-like protein